MLDILIGFLYVVFVVTALLLIVIILLQEAKGGGLAGAFGGAGTEAFGVKAGGINRFTATIASVFLLSAVVIGMFSTGTGSVVDGAEPPVIPGLPEDVGDGTGAPAEGTGTPADGAGSTPPGGAGAESGTPPAGTGGTPPADGGGASSPPPSTPPADGGASSPAPSTPPASDPEKK